MRWVLNFIKEYKIKYWLSNIMIILGSAISKVFPVVLLGKIIDDGIYKNNFSCIPYFFIISVSMYFGGRMLTYFGILIIDNIRYKLAHKLKVVCYKKLNQLDQTFYQENTIGELNTCLTTDINTIHHNMCFVVKQSMIMLVACAMAIIYCLYINPILTFIILIPTPIIAIISNKYIKNSKKLYNSQRESLSKLNSYIQENIEGNRLVKTFGAEQIEINGFKVKNRDVKKKNIDIKNININYNNKITSLSYSMQILLIIFGGIFVIQGYTTIGEFIIINSLINTIKKPFLDLSGLVNDWQQFKIAVQKIKNLLETEPKIKNLGKLELNSWNNINFDNVSLKYNQKQIIKNINLNLEPNKTYAFIGKIGSGKSTIGKILLRLIEPSEGKITFDNIPINKYTLKSLRKNIGYVSQTPFLFSDTIANNVAFGIKDLSRKEIIEYLKLSKADYVLDLPNNIDTIIGENGVNLSGGEKQRLSLARALAKRPSILILDDITSALDFETELEITNNINNLKYECTKIIIAQKILSVKNADIIFVMEGGKIIEYGSHRELLQKDGVYREIYNIQTNNMEAYI